MRLTEEMLGLSGILEAWTTPNSNFWLKGTVPPVGTSARHFYWLQVQDGLFRSIYYE